MKKTAVIYSSKYGHTKKYAEWIAQDLSADIFDLKSFDKKLLSNYETLVFGSGLYAGRIAFADILAKNIEQIKDKKIVLFTVGTGDVSNEKNTDYVKKQFFAKFPEEFMKNTKLFCLRGGVDYENLSFIHRKMMDMVHFVLSKKKPEELKFEDKEFLDVFGKKVDFTDKNSILPLVTFAKEN